MVLQNLVDSFESDVPVKQCWKSCSCPGNEPYPHQPLKNQTKPNQTKPKQQQKPQQKQKQRKPKDGVVEPGRQFWKWCPCRAQCWRSCPCPGRGTCWKAGPSCSHPAHHAGCLGEPTPAPPAGWAERSHREGTQGMGGGADSESQFPVATLRMLCTPEQYKKIFKKSVEVTTK